MHPTWKPSSPPIDIANFTGLLARHPRVLVHFWAAWNQHDRTMDERLKTALVDFPGRFVVGSVDVDLPENRSLCLECKVSCQVPALACFVGGRRVETLVGCRPVEKLKARLSLWSGQVSPG